MAGHGKIPRKSGTERWRPEDRTQIDAVDRLWKLNDRIWIPSADKELQPKLMVVSHCGIMGHRGADATKSVLREKFFWNKPDKDVEVSSDNASTAY